MRGVDGAGRVSHIGEMLNVVFAHTAHAVVNQIAHALSRVASSTHGFHGSMTQREQCDKAPRQSEQAQKCGFYDTVTDRSSMEVLVLAQWNVESRRSDRK